MLHSRRRFLKFGSRRYSDQCLGWRREAWAQVPTPARARSVQTPVLNIGFEESGDAQGFPIILLHGFPDDVRAWDAGGGAACEQGVRVIVPYLRGYGPTRFREPSAPRMAEQAAIGQDVIDLADALGCRDLRWLATTGAVARRALPQRFIPSECERPSSSEAIRFRTRSHRRSRLHRRGNEPSGISGISIPNEGAPGSNAIAVAFAGCSGKHGRRRGISRTRRSTRRRRHSTIPISSTS